MYIATLVSLASQPFKPLSAWLLTALAVLGAVQYLWSTEPTLVDVVFVAGILLTVGTLIVATWGRILVATVVVTGLFALVVALCTIKSQETNMLLHPYDFVLYVGSWAT